MKIETIKADLERTIQGKQKYRADLQRLHYTSEDIMDKTAYSAMIMFLNVNIEELKNILDAVNACIAEKE